MLQWVLMAAAIALQVVCLKEAEREGGMGHV